MNADHSVDVTSPTVSIIIPTYNRWALIEETIQSVIHQTYRAWEIIVVDDGSDDDTELLITKFNDERIRYIRIEHCGIFGKVRNQGLKIATGEYVAFLDSDDLWHEHKLRRQLELLNQYANASFVFNNVHFFGDQLQPSPAEFENLFVGNVLVPMLEEKRFVFYPSTLLFRKDVLLTTGMMNETLAYTTDMDFFYKICQHFEGIFSNTRLVKIRKHSHNTTRTVSAEILDENIYLVERLHGEGALTKQFRDALVSHYYYKMGLAQLKEKRPQKSVNAFYTYIKMQPYHWRGWVRLVQAALHTVG